MHVSTSALGLLIRSRTSSYLLYYGPISEAYTLCWSIIVIDSATQQYIISLLCCWVANNLLNNLLIHLNELLKNQICKVTAYWNFKIKLDSLLFIDTPMLFFISFMFPFSVLHILVTNALDREHCWSIVAPQHVR